MSETKLSDTRSRARGWPLALIGALCFGALVITWRAVVDATDAFTSGNYGVGVTSVLAAAAWTLGCVGIVHNGRRMRMVAFAAWIINLLGVIVGLLAPDLFSRENPWSNGGATYFYLPTLGAMVAMVWLVWSRPAAVAARQLEESRE